MLLPVVVLGGDGIVMVMVAVMVMMMVVSLANRLMASALSMVGCFTGTRGLDACDHAHPGRRARPPDAHGRDGGEGSRSGCDRHHRPGFGELRRLVA